MEREEGEEEGGWLLQTFKLPVMICGPGPGPPWSKNECPQSQDASSLNALFLPHSNREKDKTQGEFPNKLSNQSGVFICLFVLPSQNFFALLRALRFPEGFPVGRGRPPCPACVSVSCFWASTQLPASQVSWGD